jgi:hypothetical protein
VGFSVSWIAFQSKGKDDVLSATGLVDTRLADEANEAAMSGLADGLVLGVFQ